METLEGTGGRDTDAVTGLVLGMHMRSPIPDPSFDKVKDYLRSIKHSQAQHNRSAR